MATKQKVPDCNIGVPPVRKYANYRTLATSWQQFMTVTTVSSCLGVVPWGGALGWCLGVVPWGGALHRCTGLLSRSHLYLLVCCLFHYYCMYIQLFVYIYFLFARSIKLLNQNDSVATVLRQSGGGGKGPLPGDRVCLFKTAASCLYDPLGRKLRVTAVTTIWKHA